MAKKIHSFMKDAYLIIWDTEGGYNRFSQLHQWAWEVAESIALTIFVWDIVGTQNGNMELLTWCYENQEKVKMVLGNKDFLIQQIISWKSSSEIKWAISLIKELSKKENAHLKDFFMWAFLRYFVSKRFIVSHARLREWKAISHHTEKQLSGINPPPKGERYYVDPQWRVLLHGHHSREGFAIQVDKDWKTQRVCLDSRAGKWRENPLTWALIWQKQETLIILDTNWKQKRLKI